MLCKNCGYINDGDCEFCENCGQKLDEQILINDGCKDVEPFKHPNKKKGKTALIITSIVLSVAIVVGSVFAAIPFLKDKVIDPKTDNKKTFETYQRVSDELNASVKGFSDEDGYVEPQYTAALLEEVYNYAKTLYEAGVITKYSYKENDTCVYMQFDGWLDFLYQPNIKGYMAGGTEDAQIITLEPHATEFYSHYLLFADQNGADEAAEKLEETFKNLNFSTDLDNQKVTIETYRNLPSHSIIIYCGHGGVTEETGSVLFTGIDATYELIDEYYEAFACGALGVNDKCEVYITSVFFDKYVEDNAFEGSLFYLGGCSTYGGVANDKRLVTSIWNKGATAIIGNTLATSVTYNIKMIYSFFEGLTKTNNGKYFSIEEALAYAKSLHGEKDPIPETDDEHYIIGYSEVVAGYRDHGLTLQDIVLNSYIQEDEQNTNDNSSTNNESTNNPPAATNPSEKVILKEVESTGTVAYNSFVSLHEDDLEYLYLEDGIKYLDTDIFPFKHGDKYGFADKNGNVVIDAVYDNATRFFEGKAFVYKNYQYMIIDRSGKELMTIPDGYAVNMYPDGATAFKNGKAVLFGSEKMLVINENMTTKEIALTMRGEARVISTPEFSGVITYIQQRVDGESGGYYDFTYNDIYILYDLNGKVIWQMTDPADNKIAGLGTDPRPNLERFVVKNGYINIIDENRKWGLLDLKSGKTVIPCKYDYLGFLSDGLIQVKSYDKWGYVDINGNEIIKPTFAEASHFLNGVAFARNNRKDQYIIIDKKGSVVAGCNELEYRNSVIGINENGTVIMLNGYNNRYSLVTSDGTVWFTNSSPSRACIFGDYVFDNGKMYEIIIQ